VEEEEPEETEGGSGELVQLQAIATGSVMNAWGKETEYPTWIPFFYGCFAFNSPEGGYFFVGNMFPFFQTETLLTRYGNGWSNGHLFVDCNGNVFLEGVEVYDMRPGAEFHLHSANGTPILLDSYDLPIGNSTINLSGVTSNWDGSCPTCPEGCGSVDIGAITISVSKV
jgi:hypothetical protein